jgi:hypothetical protein
MRTFSASNLAPKTTKPRDFSRGFLEWATQVSNLRPLPCEGAQYQLLTMLRRWLACVSVGLRPLVASRRYQCVRVRCGVLAQIRHRGQ